MQPITYVKNGNKVGESDGAVECMRLPDEFPEDLNFEFYVDKAKTMLTKMGVNYE